MTNVIRTTGQYAKLVVYMIFVAPSVITDRRNAQLNRIEAALYKETN